jgi:hypothetical protein
VEVYRFSAIVYDLVDIGSRIFFHRPEVDYGLNFAASFLFVIVDDVHLHFGNQNGIDAVLFGQGKGLEDFLSRIVCPEKSRDVDKVSRMRPAADEITPEDKPAERKVADFTGGDFSFLWGRRFCVVWLAAILQRRQKDSFFKPYEAGCARD